MKKFTRSNSRSRSQSEFNQRSNSSETSLEIDDSVSTFSNSSVSGPTGVSMSLSTKDLERKRRSSVATNKSNWTSESVEKRYPTHHSFVVDMNNPPLYEMKNKASSESRGGHHSRSQSRSRGLDTNNRSTQTDKNILRYGNNTTNNALDHLPPADSGSAPYFPTKSKFIKKSNESSRSPQASGAARRCLGHPRTQIALMVFIIFIFLILYFILLAQVLEISDYIQLFLSENKTKN